MIGLKRKSNLNPTSWVGSLGLDYLFACPKSMPVTKGIQMLAPDGGNYVPQHG